MTFVRTSLLNAIAVAVRMASALVLNKVLAVGVGPSGFALIGQFQNAVSILTTFATAATGQGITKFTAEYNDDEARQHIFWRSAGTLTLLTSLLTAGVTVGLRYWLAEHFLHDRAQSFVFVILAAGLVLLAMNGFIVAILNGMKDVRTFVIVSVAGSIVSLIFTVALTLIWGLRGALSALAFNQSLALAATVLMCRHRPWFRFRVLFGSLDRRVMKGLGGFITMAASGAIAGPIAQIAIRGDLIAVFGKARAGEWEAMMRISTMYLLFFTSTLAVYYLPRISELRHRTELSTEVFRIFRLTVPVVMVASVIIFLLRDLVIHLLFDASFAGMRELFAWQLVGDTFKGASWIFAYVMVGRAMTVWYIGIELLFNVTWVLLSFVAVREFGFNGVSIAYAFTYSLYLCAVFFIFCYYLNRMARGEPSVLTPQRPFERHNSYKNGPLSRLFRTRR